MPEEDYSDLLAIARTPVESSNVAAMAYDPDRKIIILEYKKGGAVYAYLDCEGKLYSDLEEAESKGSFVDIHLKKAQKEYVRIR